jgi:Flp pilus assembly CpaF family ATPase
MEPKLTTVYLSRAASALSQAKAAIHIGECINVEEAKTFLAALNTGHCGCLVTPPFVPDDGTLQRIRRLMDEGGDDEE